MNTNTNSVVSNIFVSCTAHIVKMRSLKSVPKGAFFRLPQLPLDIAAVAGFLDCYSAVVWVSDNIYCTLVIRKQYKVKHNSINDFMKV